MEKKSSLSQQAISGLLGVKGRLTILQPGATCFVVYVDKKMKARGATMMEVVNPTPAISVPKIGHPVHFSLH